MNIIDEQVTHKIFGTGTVVEQAKDKVGVSFPDKGNKTFVYPDCFDGFMKLNNISMQEKMESEINLYAIAKKADKEKKREQAFLRIEEERKQTLAEKTATRKSRTSKKSGFVSAADEA